MYLLQVLQLGLVDYATALKLQETLVSMRKEGRIADTLLLLEHPAVITLGRNSKAENIVASPESLVNAGVDVFEVNRGGDVTFHGPGQLVGYPIIDLRGQGRKLGAVEYVRRLEEALIRACADFGIGAQRVPGLTGVWTQSVPPRKIAAIGVHISRGVTSHGFALNVSTDLDSFKLIIPCGISGKEVTSMEQELAGQPAPLPLDLNTVCQAFTRQFGNVFSTQVLWLDSLDALLGTAPANQDIPMRAPSELQQLYDELRSAPRDDISFSV